MAEESISDKKKIEIGNTGEEVYIEKLPSENQIKEALNTVLQKGISSIAIAFLHGYMYDKHEIMVANIAKSMGFKNISVLLCLCVFGTFLLVFFCFSNTKKQKTKKI